MTGKKYTYCLIYISKFIDYLNNNKHINKSEIAREIGISPILFRMKLKNINRNRFTSDELQKLDEVRTRLYNSL